MKQFTFEGRIPCSKSLAIRQAICNSYFAKGMIKLTGECDDILNVQKSIFALKNGGEITAGDGAAGLRFLALRAARSPGDFLIRGSKHLMNRPHEEIKFLLNQLGVSCEIDKFGIRVRGTGWHQPAGDLFVDRRMSSQFISGVVLNAWNLEFPLNISWSADSVSDGYFEMTLAVVKAMGMQFEKSNKNLRITARQSPVERDLREPDMSSAFTIAALAVAAGKCRILDFPNASLQPDYQFIKILRDMGVAINLGMNCLEVESGNSLLPLDVNLRDTPDLFPVLAILCAFAKGKSFLYGAPHLALKESNRLEKTFELLKKIGRKFVPKIDGVEILGEPYGSINENFEEIDFDSAGDHRMVMAACVARCFGFNIRIANFSAVDKSFPQLREIVNL